MLGVGRLLMKIYHIIKIISSQVSAFSSLVLAILIFLSFNTEFVFYSSDYFPFFQDFIHSLQFLTHVETKLNEKKTTTTNMLMTTITKKFKNPNQLFNFQLYHHNSLT